jgi:hypothetical protein
MMFNVGWLATHGLLCAGLLLGADLSARASDWSTRAIGGTACDSHANRIKKNCQHAPNAKWPCNIGYYACNQNPGTAKRICKVEGGNPACNNAMCVKRNHDWLGTHDANNNPCTPRQIYP